MGWWKRLAWKRSGRADEDVFRERASRAIRRLLSARIQLLSVWVGGADWGIVMLTAVKMRLDSLTGMRFLAALLVVLSHATKNFLPSGVADFFSLGGVGVSFFFVLSGFVLTWSRKDDQRAGSFYRNRFARVYPLHILTWIAAGILIIASGGAVSPLVAAACALLVQAWIPVGSYYFGMNGPSWSLSCEAFFYALFPFIVGPLSSRKPRTLWLLACWGYVLVGALTIIMHVVLRHGPTVAVLYADPAYRLWEFALGIVLASLVRSGWRSPVSLRIAVGMAAASLVFLSGLNVALLTGPLRGLHLTGLPSDLASLVMVPFFALLIATGATGDLSARASIFRSNTMVKLGDASFALYISHLLVLELLRGAAPAQLAPVYGFLLGSAGVVCSLVVAWLLHRFVERPLEARLRSSSGSHTGLEPAKAS